MLEARAISVSGHEKERLSDISVALHPGEFTAIIGPNGAGKTTLLDCLAGSLSPKSGQVLMDNKELCRWEPLALARKRAVLPQHSRLDFPFSVSEVVLMGRIPFWSGQKETRIDREISEQAMRITDCLHLQDKTYTRLSGGEQQRVQLSRVFAQVLTVSQDEPVYLLLDEPVSALDLAHQFSLMEFLCEFSRDGAGICAVMHNLNLVKRYVDRLWVLAEGKLVTTGTTADCLDAELIQQVFGVSAKAVLG